MGLKKDPRAGITDFLRNFTIYKKPWNQLTQDEKDAFKDASSIIFKWLTMIDSKWVVVTAKLYQLGIHNLESEVIYKTLLDIMPNTGVSVQFVKEREQKRSEKILSLVKRYFHVKSTTLEDYYDIIKKQGLLEKFVNNVCFYYGFQRVEQDKILKEINSNVGNED